MPQNFDRLDAAVPAFRAKLAAIKGREAGFPWYPYDTFGNVAQIKPLVSAQHDHLFAGGKRIADIGAADGDFAFLLESMGNSVDIYDYGPTNMNGLRGARMMRETLGSKAGIYEVDLDSQMKLEAQYDLVLLLGILYHLKNPYYVLETLAKACKYAFISTRIARHFHAGGPDVSGVPAAYLLSPTESNNDATNYWIFTEAGLRRTVDRAGWDVAGLRTIGSPASNPQANSADERAFAFLVSRY